MDELAFWRECCQRGITICKIPKPMKEELETWLVEKHPTFFDRKNWEAAYTFDLLDDAFRQIERYFISGEEPKAGKC